MRYTMTKYITARHIPNAHQTRPTRSVCGPESAFWIVISRLASPLEGRRRGYKAVAAPTSITVRYAHEQANALRSLDVREKYKIPAKANKTTTGTARRTGCARKLSRVSGRAMIDAGRLRIATRSSAIHRSLAAALDRSCNHSSVFTER